jgi:hydrogenase maturation factor HypE
MEKNIVINIENLVKELNIYGEVSEKVIEEIKEKVNKALTDAVNSIDIVVKS